jgi:hypothetical protein
MRIPTTLRWSRAYYDGLRRHKDGDHAGAEPALRRAVALASRMRPRDARLACSLYALARLQQVEGRLDEAQRLYDRALAAEVGALGADHPYTRMIAEACTTVARQIAGSGRGGERRPARRKYTSVSCGVPARPAAAA